MTGSKNSPRSRLRDAAGPSPWPLNDLTHRDKVGDCRRVNNIYRLTPDSDSPPPAGGAVALLMSKRVAIAPKTLAFFFSLAPENTKTPSLVH